MSYVVTDAGPVIMVSRSRARERHALVIEDTEAPGVGIVLYHDPDDLLGPHIAQRIAELLDRNGLLDIEEAAGG